MLQAAPLLLSIVVLSCQLEHSTGSSENQTTPLSFAESVYVKMSSACRAIMNFRYSALNNESETIRKMKMVLMYINKTMEVPIDAAFEVLKKPANFDIRRQTKIIIHGYRDSSNSAVPQDLAQAYNEKKIFNVLLVDAKELIDKGYILSAHNARFVGKRLANLLANLDNLGANPEDFHLLGISLGAHIAGWAGKYFRRYKAQNLGRITGLDPAGPCFSFAYSDQRLDYSDADYVDVVHSNRLIQGVIEPLGHADFYVNGGGPTQPGCIMPSCSHLRAAKVYTESIRQPKSFVGIKCKSWKHFEGNACESDVYSVLGYGSSTKSRGQFYLRTGAESPYGLGMEGTTSNNAIADMWSLNMNDTVI